MARGLIAAGVGVGDRVGVWLNNCPEWIHLVFAVTSPILWAVTIALALKRMPKPPAPSDHSPLHKKLGWASVVDLTLTSVTGLWFYYVAFVSSH